MADIESLSVRIYGKSPYTLALLHGGPGARGSLAGAAQTAGRFRGVLEPLQTRRAIPELLEELHSQLRLSEKPLALAGHSWGAWLALLYAAQFPQEVGHLVLIACPPLTEKFVPHILAKRLALLSAQQAAAYRNALEVLEHHAPGNREEALHTLEELSQRTDFFCPAEYDDSLLEIDAAQYQSVWPQAQRLRQTGALLKAAKALRCPVSVLHGQQDPHPVQGVLEPLQQCGCTPQVVLFNQCSHSPFAEKYAQAEFYRFLQTA